MNRYGNPKQENGKITRILSNTWCHQCKMKHQKIVVCDHFWDENRNSKCNGRYCTNCCKRHYGEELSSLENLDNWTCYKCANRCVCAACRRLRGANQKTETIHSNPLIQKGKRKRNKVKMIEEEDEEEEEVLEEDEEEEEFYPNVKFEKNLRSRKKNEKNVNSNNVNVQNNITIQSSKKPSPPRNTTSTNNDNKKNSSPKINNPSSSPTHHSTKNPCIPSETKKQKIPSPVSTSSSSTPQNPKIMIPQEDLDNASNSNYMFDILLQVSTLESNEDLNVPKQNNINNTTTTNVNMNSIYNNDNILSGNNQQNFNSFGNILNNKLNSAVDLHQKLVKYESVQSNPLLPSSLHHIFQLRQEVSTLTNELKNMKQDFMKLHRLFESYVQTNEGSHESSPIGYGLSDTLHNSHIENLVQNN